MPLADTGGIFYRKTSGLGKKIEVEVRVEFVRGRGAMVVVDVPAQATSTSIGNHAIFW
jgi:hypothetical protein